MERESHRRRGRWRALRDVFPLPSIQVSVSGDVVPGPLSQKRRRAALASPPPPLAGPPCTPGKIPGGPIPPLRPSDASFPPPPPLAPTASGCPSIPHGPVLHYPATPFSPALVRPGSRAPGSAPPSAARLAPDRGPPRGIIGARGLSPRASPGCTRRSAYHRDAALRLGRLRNGEVPLHPSPAFRVLRFDLSMACPIGTDLLDPPNSTKCSWNSSLGFVPFFFSPAVHCVFHIFCRAPLFLPAQFFLTFPLLILDLS